MIIIFNDYFTSFNVNHFELAVYHSVWNLQKRNTLLFRVFPASHMNVMPDNISISHLIKKSFMYVAQQNSTDYTYR